MKTKLCLISLFLLGGRVSKLVFYAQSTGAVISGRLGGGGGGKYRFPPLHAFAFLFIMLLLFFFSFLTL